jgi:two-component system phosphate regulon sensor histidine kinase PhoR
MPFRRFVIPQLIILAVALTAVTLAAVSALGDATGNNDAAFGRHLVPLLLICAVTLAVACVFAFLFAWKAARRREQEVAGLMLDAVPEALMRRPSLSDVDGETLSDIAKTLSELMDEADKNQAQLMTVISSMSDGLVATDHQQRILLTNDAARELLAFRTNAVAEARGKQLWEVIPLEPVLKSVTQVSLTGERETVPVGPVNGKYLEVTVCRLPLRPAGFVIVAHDVTETMRYEELRKEFVANVSHELRTPLTVIKGYVETLQDGALDDRPRATQYLSTVQRHTEQLTNLVDDLLSLSRLDSTSAVPSPRPVHLGRVAGKVTELMNPAAARKGHKLVLQVADGLHPIIGSPEYVERAVSNLLENAIKYTKENGLIRLIVRGEDGHTIVEVIDNGIGISADDLPRIFERFYRAERSRSRDMGGTGLGLSIVKHIMQAHGGTVEVTSAPGKGSTFRLKFPISTDETAQPDTGGAAA